MHRFLKSLLPAGALAAAFGITLAGCDLLDVENPNNLIEADLDNPAAAVPMANGAEATVTRALGAILAPYSTASDELTWVGSRDAWQQLDFGNIDDAFNEFTDAAFPFVGEATWTVDEYIGRLEAFRAEGALPNTDPLARSYLYKGIIYTSVADMFEDYVFSDRREPQPPVGSGNMVQLYDQAIDALTKGLALSPGGELETALRAMRARAHFNKGIWQKVNPDAVNTANPLVSSDAAVADAKAVLDALGAGSDWEYQLHLDGSVDALVVGDLSMALQVNDRLELRIGEAYIIPNANGKRVYGTYNSNTITYPDSSISLNDPIDGIPAPHLYEEVKTFVESQEYADITVVSARELALIVAEDALADGDMDEFATYINRVRALDAELSDYSTDDAVDAVDLLEHMRQVNLFLQGRRLADMYRFGSDSPEWNSSAKDPDGTFLPITITEINANPNLTVGG